MSRLAACPKCGASWIGDEIPPEVRHHHGGGTHGYRSIRVYDRDLDCWVATRCPDCGHEVPRDAGEVARAADPEVRRPD